jgi:hypothetical protein
MNCTAVGRYYFTGGIYGDYIGEIEKGFGDKIAKPSRKNI